MDILEEKYKLITSDDYKRIRELQIEEIIKLSASKLNSLELRGMLKLIYKTDKWKEDYEKSKEQL